jgi:HPt (histidine-containing phosphotransfer) domain-containing protein
MERLRELTDGSPENLRELISLYLDQTSEQLLRLEAALKTNQAAEARRLAHSCAGASSTCGMRRLALLLREVERQSAEANLQGAAELCRDINAEFECVRHFLQAYLAAQSGLVPNPAA